MPANVCVPDVFDVWMSVYVFYSKKVMKNDYLILEWETRWNVYAILEPRHWHKASIEYKPSIHIRWHSHKPVAVFSYKIFRCKTRDRVQGFSPWIWLEVKRCQGPDESSLMKRDFTCRGLAATLLCSCFIAAAPASSDNSPISRVAGALSTEKAGVYNACLGVAFMLMLPQALCFFPPKGFYLTLLNPKYEFTMLLFSTKSSEAFTSNHHWSSSKAQHKSI